MGFLYSLFGGAPTKYDAQKYFDYAEKQKAKGNIVEALSYYAKVINHGDLGVKPFVPYIELCMEHDEWKKLPDCIKVYRKRFPKENSGWIDKTSSFFGLSSDDEPPPPPEYMGVVASPMAAVTIPAALEMTSLREPSNRSSTTVPCTLCKA